MVDIVDVFLCIIYLATYFILTQGKDLQSRPTVVVVTWCNKIFYFYFLLYHVRVCWGESKPWIFHTVEVENFNAIT